LHIKLGKHLNQHYSLLYLTSSTTLIEARSGNLGLNFTVTHPSFKDLLWLVLESNFFVS